MTASRDGRLGLGGFLMHHRERHHAYTPMKPFGNERYMGLIPLAVLIFVVTVLAGGPGPLIDWIDRFTREVFDAVVGWINSVRR